MPFDYELFVIGAGSGGLAAAERAASYGARVVVSEEANTGGACVNYGCIPEKLLDYAASFSDLNQVASSYGWSECDRRLQWSKFVAAKDRHIQHLNQVHCKHLQEAGVEFLQGHTSFLDAHTLLVSDRQVTAAKILVAVGAKPEKPDLPGIEHTITWRELYHLPEQPHHLVIFGSDPIGVKVAGSLNALGSQVTLITETDYILPTLDTEISQTIQARMAQQGVRFLNRTGIKQIEKVESYYHLTLTGDEAAPTSVDAVLIDAPRRPNLTKLNLDKASVQLTEAGAISVDTYSRTSQANIFAIGDCTDRIPLTPSAIAQARAFADSEFGNLPRTVSFEWVPFSISSHPEAATVGLSETQAREKFGDAVYCYRTQFRPLFYCLAQLPEKVFIKLIVNQDDNERILGVHIVGDGAVEITQSLAVALKLGATKQDLNTAIGIHPSIGEEIFTIR